jgi:hypothetical protein
LDVAVAAGPDDASPEGAGHRVASRRPGLRATRLPSFVPGLLAAGALVALSALRLGRRPLWLDESFTIGATHDLAATWRNTGGTMGLYYLVMWPVTQLSTDRAWVRLPSLLFAAAAVVVVHEIGRRLGGRRVAALAAMTLALMWGTSRYAIEARSYSLALLLVSLGWLGLVGALRADADGALESRRRWWRLFVVAMLLAPLAHGLAALHLPPQLALLGVLPERRRWWRACAPLIAGLVVEGGLLFGIGAGEVASWVEPLDWSQVRALLHMLFGHGLQFVVVTALAVTGGVVGVRRARRLGPGTDAALALVPLVWAIGMPLLIVAISVFRPYTVGRYVLGALPGVALLVAWVVARVRPQVRFTVAAVVLAGLLLFDQPKVTAHDPEDWPALVDRVVAEGHDGDRLVTRDMLRAPFDYAWGEHGGSDRPDLVPLSPRDPFDQVLRFYEAPGGRLQAPMVDDPSAPVWYIERDHRRRADAEALLADPAVLSRYEVTGRWTFPGELYLVRLEPR